jgi:hypothetical protein
MNELFKSEKIWPPSIIFPKKHAFKRLGVLGIIFLFGTAAFISGFSINSYAASSSTVLPISRGGTNANTAAQASSNILGSDFANYNGVLPVAKGGTGTSVTSNNDTTAISKNLYINPRYFYGYTYHFNDVYFKVMEFSVTGGSLDYRNSRFGQSVQITGSNKHVHSPFEVANWTLTYSPKNNSNVIDNTRFTLIGHHTTCRNNKSPMYAIYEPIDENSGTVKVFLWRPAYQTEPTLEWYYTYNAGLVQDWTPEVIKLSTDTGTEDRPADALNIYPYCTVYTSPSPTPTPTPTPTETP